jgi:hypothetical protein
MVRGFFELSNRERAEFVAEYNWTDVSQALGLPDPPRGFPRHLYFARLAKFGKCSPESLANFMARDFFKLSDKEQLEFVDEYNEPSVGRECYFYRFLYVWLADNAPVFNEFRARWQDILKAARDRFNTSSPEDYRVCPKDADQLKALWKDFEDKHWPGQPRLIRPLSGRPKSVERCAIPADLLTRLPFVSAARKG